MTTRFTTAAILLSLGLTPAFAMDSTEILPKGVNSPAFRYGIVSGVDSKYTADGSVMSLNEINTVNFNSDQIAKINPEVTSLVNILNQFSQQQLGSQINLGTLRVETEPNVKYVAPIYARGITERLTLAVAMPVVFYENKLRLNQSSSNVPQICAQFAGIEEDIPELKTACKELGVKVVDATQNELAKKGYRRIQDRKETVMGDAQMVSLWKLHEEGRQSALLRTTITLPTGQKNNPDDLADLGIFGLTAVEPALIVNQLWGRRIRLAAKAGYKFVVPDSTELRVPGSEGDILPGPETKENVSRRVGGTAFAGGAVNLTIGDSFGLAGGYEYSLKGADNYSGSRGARYELLAKDSKSSAHRIRGGITYDTIALYQRKKNFPPLKLDYEIINTIAGSNSDRQLVNEFSLTMFF